MNKANAYGRLGGKMNLREAVRLYDRAISVLTALFGSEHQHVRVVIHNRAIALRQLNNSSTQRVM
jgi:hypothetical protein